MTFKFIDSVFIVDMFIYWFKRKSRSDTKTVVLLIEQLIEIFFSHEIFFQTTRIALSSACFCLAHIKCF